MLKNTITTYLIPLILGGLLALCGFFIWKTVTLDNELEEMTQKRNTAEEEIAILNTTISDIEVELTQLNLDYEALRDDYSEERNKNENFEDRIDDLAGTLGNLNKLAKTDKELLQKYSKVYFLNENYAPESIRKIDSEWILEGKDDQYFHKDALSFLEDLLEDAKRDDIDLKVVSAYRSFNEQADLKGQFTQVYGNGANAFSADQGYSEHQLGTTVDITIDEIGGTYTSFAQTEAYQWLLDNAYKHGFVLSYPEDNGYYVFEPWHWRFVGEELARDLHKDRENFYDMDQRDIDEYLISVFD